MVGRQQDCNNYNYYAQNSSSSAPLPPSSSTTTKLFGLINNLNNSADNKCQQQSIDTCINIQYCDSIDSASRASSPASSDKTSSSSFADSSPSSLFASSTNTSSSPASIASPHPYLSNIEQTHNEEASIIGNRRYKRKKNASAAEKYRKRVKGRNSGLVKIMSYEQARNNELKRELNAKLSLYREFVALLANNTCRDDLDLAEFGTKSLSNVLISVCDSTNTAFEKEVYVELQARLETFKSILLNTRYRYT